MHWLQQLTNGLALGSIYALIALGYTMVYGVLRFINFAHSDVLMLGAYSAFYLAPKMEAVFGPQSAVGTLFIIIAAAAICAVIGILIELLAYRPLRNRPKLTVLITAIGGLLLGVLETVAGGIPGVSIYRDGIAFAILILILIFRPAGLLGRAVIEKV